MNEAGIIQYIFNLMNEIPHKADSYLTGILLNDKKIKTQINILTHMQAIIIQSLQMNDIKRAVKYALAYRCIIKKSVLKETSLKESITKTLKNNT